MYELGALYECLAKSMPTEGVDFSIGTRDSGYGQTEVALTPLTPLGEAWAPFARTIIDDTMPQVGMRASPRRETGLLIASERLAEGADDRAEAHESAVLISKITEKGKSNGR